MTDITSFQFECDDEVFIVNVQSKLEPFELNTTTLPTAPIPHETHDESDEDESYGVIDDAKAKVQQMKQQAQQRVEQITQERIRDSQRMIRGYAAYVISAFKDFKAAEINEITLKFGLKMGSKFSLPCITEGSAESNVEIEVKCKLLK